MSQTFAYQGFGYASWYDGNFASAAADSALDQLAATNANSIAITATYYVDSLTASHISAHPTRTESLASVADAIDHAHARGLSVMLKPHIDSLDDAWRMNIAPTDVDAWFRDYKAIIVDYARTAQEHHAEMLAIGTELDQLAGPQYLGYWTDIIGAVRAVYDGKLTYASGWNTPTAVSFWDQLDVVGVDAYVPMSPATQPTIADFVSAWTTPATSGYLHAVFGDLSPVDYYHQLSLATGKPLIFTEIGYSSGEKAAADPANWHDPGTADQALQADLFTAFFDVWTKQDPSWFKGAFVWNWEPYADASTGDANWANDYTVQQKLAESVIRDWYGGAGPAVDATPHGVLLLGTAGDDVLVGGVGNDLIDGGGSGAGDTMSGGRGDDTFIVHSALDRVSEQANEGTDLVNADAPSFTLGSNVENLVYIGNGDFIGTGNGLANVIRGGAGNDVLDGKTGADTLIGGAGDDSYYVENALDRVVETSGNGHDIIYSTTTYALPDNVEDLRLIGSYNVNATGNWLDNVLTGNSGANVLDGAGSLHGDTLIGGGGNDTYIARTALDRIVEMAGGGIDTVKTALASFDLRAAANVENLTYTGTGNFTGTGNDLANAITGGAGNDWLDGGAGLFPDTLSGGDGNDTYVIRNLADVIRDTSGVDTIRTDLALYDLNRATAVENLTYTGAGDFTGIGNGLANTLTGGRGSDVLDGRGGADTMTGGAGDDTYYVDNVQDRIVESGSADGGRDLVISTVSLTLAANVEDLTLAGTLNLNATGNWQDNVITGNAGANILDGFGSLQGDTLIGGAGNDTYIIRNTLDRVVETADGGIDTVKTSFASFDLRNAPNVENLTYTGTGNFTGIGNGLANTITGGAGNDWLDGGGGNDWLDGSTGAPDTLVGGAGNDTYVVHDPGDIIRDSSGIDTIRTDLAAYDLNRATAIENLTYTGGGNFTGTGNGLANILRGGDGNDLLAGGAGVDTLYGGAGNDRLDGGNGVDMLVGGTGADVFVLRKGEANGDTVYDFSHSQGDQLELVGYGAGTTIQQVVGSATDWAIVDGIDHSQTIIHINTKPILVASDWHFA